MADYPQRSGFLKMTNKFFLKASKFFLYLVPFTILVVSRSTLFPFIVGKYFFFRVFVDLALIAFVWAWAKGELSANSQQPINNKNNKPASFSARKLLSSPLVIAVFVFTFIFLLAGFLGYNPSASFWSNFERGEGGLQILHLFIFFALMVLLFRDEKSWRKMLKLSILAAVLMISYGLLAAVYNKAGQQVFPSFMGPSLCDPNVRFSGSLGNPAYLGTFMIFSLFFTAVLLNKGWKVYKKWLKWLLAGLLVFFSLALLFSQTRGALLGLIAGIIFGLFYLLFSLPKGKMRKIVFAGTVIFIIIGGLVFQFRHSLNLMPFCKNDTGANRILDITPDATSFQTRLLLWKQALILTKERPLLGWGPENFSPAFEKHYRPEFTVWFDRAHSVYFDYLAETGILGFLSYLGIFAVFYWQFFKKMTIGKNLLSAQSGLPADKKDSANARLFRNALFFALPVAYLVQGIVLFEVLPIYICLFTFLAFMNFKFNETRGTDIKI